MTRPKKSLQI